MHYKTQFFNQHYIKLDTSHPQYVGIDKYNKKKNYALSCNIKPHCSVKYNYIIAVSFKKLTL